jgi:hypothetical protein
MDHDWYNFVTHFWWLVFPFIWMLAAFARIMARHRESQRILDMIQSYTAQGKEPPAALVEMFKAPRMSRQGCGRYEEPYYTHRLWRRAFLFALLCVLFAGSAWWRHTYPRDMGHHEFGWIIAALVLGALALSNVMALMTRPRLPPPDFKPDQK